MQTVGAHDQVELAGSGALEGDVDAVGGLLDLGDGVAVQVLGVLRGGFVQESDEVPAQQFAGASVLRALRTGEPGQAASARVDEVDGVDLGAGGDDLVEQPHALDDVEGDPAQVDGVPALPESG